MTNNNFFYSLTRRVDLLFVLTLLLCLFSAWPLLYQPGLPNGTDTLYHAYRVAEMDRAWAHGVLMPHWAETFYYGYGSPVFHYYASMTYYFTSILMRLFALDAVNSLRLFTTLCMLLAGGGMYLFMCAQAGRLAGVIAALVYVYAPYILFTEPYARGAYPELLALAWFPLVMWRYWLWLIRGGGRSLALAALSSGMLILMHNLMALVLTGLLAVWLVWGALAHEATARRAAWGLAALMLGVGLAAYFWLPVMLERDAVRLENLTAVAQLDYRNFFVPLAELLAFSPRPDAGAINGLLHQLNLGVAQWVLALSGVLALLKAPVVRCRAVIFALAALIFLVLMLPVAQVLWQVISPLAYLQFPWRFLGPMAFCLAVLAGYNVVWLDALNARLRTVAIGLIVALPVVLALPTLYVDEWDWPTIDTSVPAYHAAELSGLQRATTFSDEYLPRTVIAEPSSNDRLLADYADGYPVDRANYDALPQGVTLMPTEHGPQLSAWQSQADAAYTLEALTYYFPGWQAFVDGESVPVQASEPHGMITFAVPAGSHSVVLRLGFTGPRWLGVGVSVLAAVAVVLLTVWLGRTSPKTDPVPLRREDWRGVLLGGALALMAVMAGMREGWAWVNSPPGVALPAADKTVYQLGDQVRLIGHDLARRSYQPGDRLDMVLYWYAPQPVAYGYATFVHISAGGPPLAQADQQNPAGRPTLEWTSEGYIRDPYTIFLPADMPAGTYQVMVGMYTCDTLPPGECGNGDRLQVADSSGQPLGDAVPLGQIVVN